MVQPTKTRIAAEEYFQLAEYEQHDLIQLIDGEVISGMPPVPRHQSIVGEILFLFLTIVKAKGGKAFTSPIEVFLDQHNVFEPDVLFLRPDSRCEVGDKRLQGAPDLVVEVLSPGTAKHDRKQKFAAYEKHGVTEYWIVDPVHQVIEVWTTGDEDTFDGPHVYDGEDTFKSSVLDEQVEVKAIFRE